MNYYLCKNKKKKDNNYRKELSSLLGRKFLIAGWVSCHAEAIVPSRIPGGNKQVIQTLCLENISCLVRDKHTGKHIRIAKVDHAWLMENESVIVTDKSIKDGTKVQLIAEVKEYTKLSGKKQLGLKQVTNSKHHIVNK